MLRNSLKMIKTDQNISELWQIVCVCVSKYNVTLVHLVMCDVNSKVYICLFSVDEQSVTRRLMAWCKVRRGGRSGRGNGNTDRTSVGDPAGWDHLE
jgi:hypothetical protein